MKEIKMSEPVVLAESRSVDPVRLAEVREMVVFEGRKMFKETQRSRQRLVSEDFYKPLR